MVRLIAILLVLVGPLSSSLSAAEKEVGLRMIIVSQKDEANAIVKQLRKGASFTALAHAKSLGELRRSWGLSGVVRLDEVDEALRPTLQNLKLGKVSKPTRLRKKYAILKAISPQIPRLYETAQEAMQKGETKSAVRALRTALKLESDSVQTYLLLGHAYSKAKQHSAAIQAMEKARSYAADEPGVSILLATVYANAAAHNKQKPLAKKAIAAYQRAMKLDKSLAPMAHFGLGKLYVETLKQPDKAIGYLEKAVAVTPNAAEAHGMLIQAYYDSKRYKRAWRQLRQAQQQGFEFPNLLAALHKVKKK